LSGVPRFYFHLINDFDTPDEEGKELSNLEAAREYARRCGRVTIAESVKDQGRFDLDHRIDIENERGEVLETVWFRDVVQVEG
jgi:hypothetical protein